MMSPACFPGSLFAYFLSHFPTATCSVFTHFQFELQKYSNLLKFLTFPMISAFTLNSTACQN